MCMKLWQRLLIIGGIVAGSSLFGVMLLREKNPTPQEKYAAGGDPTSVPTRNPKTEADLLAAMKAEFADWTYFRNGYALPVPPGWKNTSTAGGRAVLVPGSANAEAADRMKEMSLTVLSDASAPQGQQFTTQREFDDWRQVEGEVRGAIQKLANTTLDGVPAVELLDTGGTEADWTIIVWARKDGRNVYLTVKGMAGFDIRDAAAVEYMVNNFKFSAPPSTGTK